MTRNNHAGATLDAGIALKNSENCEAAIAKVHHEHVVHRLNADTCQQNQPNQTSGLASDHPAKPDRRPKLLAMTVAVILLIVGGGWCLRYYGPAIRDTKQTVQGGTQEGKATLGFTQTDGAHQGTSTPIETIRVEKMACSDRLRLTGALAADEKSEVGSNAAGIVAETRVERGSFVKKGDVLVQLDPRDARYALDDGENTVEELRVRLGLKESKEFRAEDVPEVQAAKLASELAEKNYRRAEELKPGNAISRSDADQIDMEYRSAIQRHRLALLLARQLNQSYRSALTHLAVLQKALDDCSIRAPFDGVVGERNISVGERVIALFPGAKLVTLLRIDPLRLSLTVPQQEMARVQVGQTVTFETDAFPGKTFTGTVRYITPAVATDTRSLCVEAIVPNPGDVLRPGLFVTAELQFAQQKTEIYVPRAAVCNRGDVAAVFIVRDGIAREQVVALGKTDREKTAILAGLTGNETLVAHPELIHDGDAVR